MNYIPKKFTSATTVNSQQQQQQQQQQAPQVNKVCFLKFRKILFYLFKRNNSKTSGQKTSNGGLLTPASQTSQLSQSSNNGLAEKCFACEKTVYAMEKIEADKKVYHKLCFKCTSCNCTLK
jgi:hypothetical protein